MDQRDVSTLLVEAFDHASFLYVNSKFNSGRFSGLKYHKPEIDHIKRKWAALEYNDEKARFREERKAFITECHQFSRQASEWQTTCKIQRSREGHKLKNERFEAVKEKLREEGFGEVLNRMRITDIFRLKKLGPVNRPSKLTDKGWKSIRPSIIQFIVPLLEKYRQELKDQATQARIRYLRKALDIRQSNGACRTAESDREPGFFELAMMPAFQTLLRDESTDARDEVIAAKFDVNSLIETWTNYYRGVFAELALLGLGESPTTLDLANLLDLAIVHFTCTRCKRRQLRWPHVLSHRCFRDKSTSLAHYVGSYYHFFLGATRSNHDAPYRGEELASFDDHLEVARDIIMLAGLAPDRATYADMEASGARFFCRGCPISTKKMAYDWQAAIRHATIMHSTGGVDRGPVWELLPLGQAAVVRDFEWVLQSRNIRLSELEKNPLNVFGCALCPWHGDILSVKAHLHFA
uniref:Ketoreductase CTB6 ) n=1 Tax=Ganoderma boninense TaxID=34458 RepID=A0A5K1K015_9APHY|nr:Ketoreductase CTB6 (EC (Cercosporin toxin biosynthesis cluster protein 6) [Ganoderma boninense]